MVIITIKKLKMINRKIIQAMREEFNCTLNTTTITRTCKRFKYTGSIADRSPSGRLIKCSARDERVFCRLALANMALSICRLSGVASTRLTRSLSRDSIRPILLRYGHRRRISARVSFLYKNQRHKVAWDLRHVIWPAPQWSRVVFSDEKIFRVSSNRHGFYVTRFFHEKYKSECGPKFEIRSTNSRVGSNWNSTNCSTKIIYGNLNVVQY